VGGDQRLQHGLDAGRALSAGRQPAGQPGPDAAPVGRRVDLVRGDVAGVLVVVQDERQAGQRLGRVGVGLELGLLADLDVLVRSGGNGGWGELDDLGLVRAWLIADRPVRVGTGTGRRGREVRTQSRSPSVPELTSPSVRG